MQETGPSKKFDNSLPQIFSPDPETTTSYDVDLTRESSAPKSDTLASLTSIMFFDSANGENDDPEDTSDKKDGPAGPATRPDGKPAPGADDAPGKGKPAPKSEGGGSELPGTVKPALGRDSALPKSDKSGGVAPEGAKPDAKDKPATPKPPKVTDGLDITWSDLIPVDPGNLRPAAKAETAPAPKVVEPKTATAPAPKPVDTKAGTGPAPKLDDKTTTPQGDGGRTTTGGELKPEVKPEVKPEAEKPRPLPVVDGYRIGRFADKPPQTPPKAPMHDARPVERQGPQPAPRYEPRFRPFREPPDERDRPVVRGDKLALPQPKDVTIDKAALRRLAPDVAKFADDVGIERASIVRKDGQDYLVLDFAKRDVPKKSEFKAGDGLTAGVTQNPDGSTKVDLKGIDGCRAVKVAEKIVAKIDRNADGSFKLRDIKGVKAEVDPGSGLPWVWADIKDVAFKPNGDKAAKVSVTGGLAGIDRTIPFDLPLGHANKVRDLVAAVDKARRAGDPKLAPKDKVDDLLKPPADKDDDSWINYLDKILAGSVVASILGKAIYDALRPNSTAPRDAAMIDGLALPRRGELLVDAEGRVRTEKEVKPDTKVAASVKVDADGKIILTAKEGSKIHVRTADGEIKKVAPGSKVELKPGDRFSTGGPEFRTVGAQRVPSHTLRIQSPNGTDVNTELRINENQVFEFGQGDTTGQVERPGLAGRVEVAIPGLSSQQARFGMDSKGLFITEGGMVNGSNEMVPAEKGTFVNGQRMRPGEKRYLKAQ
ncbi:MAG: hypothetical protein K2X93_28065, partial [Candidatus Obscuribacterales bacterium]|nr:hypothetical protein [Candidatus Obscuribacterales bacterium]